MNPDRLPERLTAAGGLRLRRLVVADAEALALAVSESIEHLRPWMPWVAQEPLTLPARRTMLGQREHEWKRGEDVMLGIFVDGAIAGACGLHRRIGPDGLEIGYWLGPRFLHRGIATRTVVLLTDAALAHPGITHVEIHTDAANTSSRAVAARAGYTLASETPRPPQAPGETGIEMRWRIDQALAAIRRGTV